jgi:hypothetical protein
MWGRWLVVALLAASGCDTGAVEQVLRGRDGGVTTVDGGFGTTSIPPLPNGNPEECAAVLASRPPAFDSLGFFEKLTFATHFVYADQGSLVDMGKRAERVFVAKLVATELGFYYPSVPGGRRCERGVMHTTNLIFEVKETLRGVGPQRVAVEWPHSRYLFPSDLAGLVPTQDMLVFLQAWHPTGPLPPGTKPPRANELALFFTPLGLVTELTPGALSFPLEPERESWPAFPGDNLTQVIEAVRSN